MVADNILEEFIDDLFKQHFTLSVLISGKINLESDFVQWYLYTSVIQNLLKRTKPNIYLTLESSIALVSFNFSTFLIYNFYYLSEYISLSLSMNRSSYSSFYIYVYTSY